MSPCSKSRAEPTRFGFCGSQPSITEMVVAVLKQETFLSGFVSKLRGSTDDEVRRGRSDYTALASGDGDTSPRHPPATTARHGTTAVPPRPAAGQGGRSG